MFFGRKKAEKKGSYFFRLILEDVSLISEKDIIFFMSPDKFNLFKQEITLFLMSIMKIWIDLNHSQEKSTIIFYYVVKSYVDNKNIDSNEVALYQELKKIEDDAYNVIQEYLLLANQINDMDLSSSDKYSAFHEMVNSFLLNIGGSELSNNDKAHRFVESMIGKLLL